jgi:hypothetical protein
VADSNRAHAVSGIKAVPKRYRGTQFRSTLEADWAATFDQLGWHWQYEPVAIELPDGTPYLPDFYLPSQRVWCEVKGPHNERIKSPIDLQKALDYEATPWEWSAGLVVILRPPGPGERAMWEGTRDDQCIVLVRCPHCQHHGFMDLSGLWACRRHLRASGQTNKFWNDAPGGVVYHDGEYPFTRVKRKGGK